MTTLLEQLQNSFAKCTDLGEELSSKGYKVIDNALSADFLRELRDEIIFLDDCRVLESSPNSLNGRDGENLILTKPGIWELSLILRGKQAVGDGTLGMVPNLKSLWDNQEELLAIFKSSCKVLESLTAVDQIKVALLKEGGAFAVHTDTHPSTGRTLSVTLYLHEEYDQEKDAGELQVFPSPYEPEKVAPVFGRMVLFSSCNLFHRVLPSKSEQRFCLSLMFYGSDSAFPYQSTLPCFSNETQDELFAQSRILTPLIYQDDFRQSILEAFTNAEQKDAVQSAVDHFDMNCDKAKSVLSAELLNAVLQLPIKRQS